MSSDNFSQRTDLTDDEKIRYGEIVKRYFTEIRALEEDYSNAIYPLQTKLMRDKTRVLRDIYHQLKNEGLITEE